MRDGGIKVWLLTGDKVETAKNIGYSSNLLSRDMEIFEIVSDNEHQISINISKI